MAGMITGLHTLVHADDADAARAFFRDVLGGPHVDAHDGWLIFGTGPSELGVHPTEEGAEHHEISLVCDDIEQTVTELTAKGATFAGAIENRGFGRTVALEIPGAGQMMLYQTSAPDGLRSLSPSALVCLRGSGRGFCGHPDREPAEVFEATGVTLLVAPHDEPGSLHQPRRVAGGRHPPTSRRWNGSMSWRCHLTTPASGDSPCSRKWTAPPGRTTRHSSESACSGSGTVHRVKVKSAASHDASSSGMCWPSRPTNVTGTRDGADPALGHPPGHHGRLHGEDCVHIRRVVGHVEARPESDLDDATGQAVGCLRPPTVEPGQATGQIHEARNDLLTGEPDRCTLPAGSRG